MSRQKASRPPDTVCAQGRERVWAGSISAKTGAHFGWSRPYLTCSASLARTARPFMLPPAPKVVTIAPRGTGERSTPPPVPEIRPQVPPADRRQGHRLAAVQDRAAAHCQDEVDPILLDQTGPLQGLLIGGAGRDVREIHHLLAGPAEDTEHLVVQAAALHRPAAVGQEHVGAVLLHEAGQILLDAAPPKDHLRVALQDKILHRSIPLSRSVLLL